MIESELKACLTSAGPDANDLMGLDIAPNGQLQVYPRSVNELGKGLFFVARHNKVKALYILAPNGEPLAGDTFEGDAISSGDIEAGLTLRVCPMNPATAMGADSSAIISISESSARTSWSMVLSFSPFLARRTIMRRPPSLSKSKAWSGCPVSMRT